MEPPDDGRTWIASTTGKMPDIDPNELIWTWLDNGVYGGNEHQQRHGLRAGAWAWWPSHTTNAHYVTHWTSDPPFAPKSGADLITILLRAHDGTT